MAVVKPEIVTIGFTLCHYNTVNREKALAALKILFPNNPEGTLDAILKDPPGYKIGSAFIGEKKQLDSFVKALGGSGIIVEIES